MTGGTEPRDARRSRRMETGIDIQRREPVKPMITPHQTERLDLDAIDARMTELREKEMAETASVSPGIYAMTTVDLPAEVQKIKDENERLRHMVLSAMDSRNRAREFMTIWSDPRKLPELIQEIYISDPDIANIKKAMTKSDQNYPPDVIEATAQRAARLKAHVALTYELHPMVPGMIYSWVDKGAVVTEVGWRGSTELINRHEYLDTDGPRPMTEAEKELHGIGPEDRGAVFFVHDWQKMDRFLSHGLPAPAPVQGVGAWRAKGQYGKPDNIPQGRTGQWVAEKDAVKDAARKTIAYPVRKMADAEILDVVYDTESGMWRLPINTADWLNDQRAVTRFENLMKEHGITDGDFNEFLGYNWRHSQLDPVAIKAEFDRFLSQRDAIDSTAIVIDPADDLNTTTVLVEQPKPAPMPAPARNKPAAQPEASADLETDGETEPPKVKDAGVAAPAPKMCKNCGLEPAVETPVGNDLCESCAKHSAK